MSKRPQEIVCVCPCRRAFVPDRPNQTHYNPATCRGRAYRARMKARPPLVVRNVETVSATDLESGLLEAMVRRAEYGNPRSEIKRVLIRVANLVGTDQGRRSDGTFTQSGWTRRRATSASAAPPRERKPPHS